MSFGKPIGEISSEPNVVPMADIMLVLLIIFMVITPMLQKGVSVDLVRTQNPRSMPDADREDAVVVAITRDGKIFLGSDATQLGDLVTKVQAQIASRVDKTVYIKSDARAKYERVVTVVDEVRSAGVDQLGLLTDRIEGQQQRTMAAPATFQ
ncbi:MAG: biopolymer transporter ExbD [Acidobacteria bacterium RIFCSPLOWO2_02_FULL_59_13]|nr:MAG: biopolymer transporter ExbD [Acidobacteria bacterium RIFCSPLOWO2_02_FULL_59_13]